MILQIQLHHEIIYDHWIAWKRYVTQLLSSWWQGLSYRAINIFEVHVVIFKVCKIDPRSSRWLFEQRNERTAIQSAVVTHDNSLEDWDERHIRCAQGQLRDNYRLDIHFSFLFLVVLVTRWPWMTTCITTCWFLTCLNIIDRKGICRATLPRLQRPVAIASFFSSNFSQDGVIENSPFFPSWTQGQWPPLDSRLLIRSPFRNIRS